MSPVALFLVCVAALIVAAILVILLALGWAAAAGARDAGTTGRGSGTVDARYAREATAAAAASDRLREAMAAHPTALGPRPDLVSSITRGLVAADAVADDLVPAEDWAGLHAELQVLDDVDGPMPMELLVEYRARCSRILALVATFPQAPLTREVEDLVLDARADMEARIFAQQTAHLDGHVGGAA